ncbi:MAG: hypothetical protein DSY35_01075, partial [Desulfurobacterium sp.]
MDYGIIERIGVLDYAFLIFTLWRMIIVGKKGALKELFLWVGVAVGFFVAWNVSLPVSKVFHAKEAGDFIFLTTAVSVFFVIFFLLFFKRIGEDLSDRLETLPLIFRKLNGLFGVLVGIFEGLVFLSYLIFAISLSEPKNPFLRGSLLGWLS